MKKRNITRNVRDTLFVDLFSKDRDGKRNFLSVYNSLHGTSLRYEDTPIEDVHLDQVLYHSFSNDVSMLIDGKIVVLCEHQATVNENMPLRCLFYISRIYERQTKNEDRFRRKQISIPFPEFYVFYNGEDLLPPKDTLRLSNALKKTAVPFSHTQLELEVTVYNINRYQEIPEIRGNPPLTQYAEFSKLIGEERKCGGEDYLERAIKNARKLGILAEYLERKGKEVNNMFFGEYDYETDIRVQREEAREEGLQETARNALAMGLSVEQISRLTGLSADDIQQLSDAQG